ncbi:MAG: right-handed parallel beta-helix repeat-containing protein [Pseudomonadota bacterium]|nr:right-handed parallel beta-helix repeat-containing protein [Pseudomonadota bacterium]
MIRSCSEHLGSVLVLLILAGASFNASAQATRTWVSGVGDDANPCSRTAPCKTFAGAISKTAANGEISVLDPGGFGAVTITKSITINGTGTLGSILSAGAGTSGIVVNAGPADVVIVRGISINGAGTSSYGIRFIAGRALHVEGVSIYGFGTSGISFKPSGSSDLYVSDTTIQRNVGIGSGGIHVAPVSPGTAFVTLDNVRLQQNHYGIRIERGSNVAASNCVITGNTNNGALVYAPFGASQLLLDGCTVSSNGSDTTHAGIKAEGAGANVRISNNVVTDNTVGLLAAGGQIVSFGSNIVGGNATDGAPTATVTTR